MKAIILALAITAVFADTNRFLDFTKFANQPTLSKYECLQGLKDDAAFVNSMLNKYDAQGPSGVISYFPFLQSWTKQAQSHLKECLESRELFGSVIELATKDQAECQNQIKLLADKVNVVVKAIKSGNVTFAMEHTAEAAQAFVQVMKQCTGTTIASIPFNVSHCLDNTKELMKDATEVYSKYEKGQMGLHHLLNATEELLKDLPEVVNSCGGNETKKYLEDKLGAAVSVSCQKDLSIVLNLVESIIKKGVPTNPLEIIGDLGQVRNMIGNMSRDCVNNSAADSALLMKKFIRKLESQKMSNKEIKGEAINLMENLVMMHPEATILAVEKNEPKKATSECSQAVGKLMDLGKKFVNDYSAGSTATMMADLAEVFPLLKDVISACV